MMKNNISLAGLLAWVLLLGGCITSRPDSSGKQEASEERKLEVIKGVESLKVGMSEQVVVGLLGVPDKIAERRSPRLMFEWGFKKKPVIGIDYSYWLVRNSVDKSAKWLSVHFDRGGRLYCWRGNVTGVFFEKGKLLY